MTLIQSSILYNYLYSPKSWFHHKSTIAKVFTVFCYLIYLPYMPLSQISCTLFFLLYLYKSINIPNRINKSLKKITLMFVIFTIINVQDQQALNSDLLATRKYIQIFPLNEILFRQTRINTLIGLKPSYLISLSFIRLLSIHFISLLMIKFLLMTTLYENILYLFIKQLSRTTNQIYQTFLCEINIAIEFIQVIFKCLEIIKHSYIIRFLEFNKTMSYVEHLTIYFFCVKQFLTDIQKQIYTISESLYSREIY